MADVVPSDGRRHQSVIDPYITDARDQYHRRNNSHALDVTAAEGEQGNRIV